MGFIEFNLLRLCHFIKKKSKWLLCFSIARKEADLVKEVIQRCVQRVNLQVFALQAGKANYSLRH